MNGASKRIWLLLYKEGGWWTVAEVRRHFGLPSGSNRLHVTLGEMASGGFLESKDEPDYQLERRVRFGVTKRCKVPRGVKLEEIEALLAMGQVLKVA